MNSPVSPHMVAFLILGTIAPLSAQNLVGTSLPSDFNLKAGLLAWTETYEIPAMEKAESEFSPGDPVFTLLDAITLNEMDSTSRNVDSVVDIGVLRNPSPYRRLMVSTGGIPYEVSTQSLQSNLAGISAIYRESGKPEKSSDCEAISLSVEHRIKLDPSKLLEITELEVGANPGCACEVVKTAIKTSEADAEEVVAIVEVAVHASPESMRIISQCAIAANPDAIAGVQALLARLDPGAGDGDGSSKSAKSAKDAKDAKVATATSSRPPLPNPLDMPVIGPPFSPPIGPPPIFPNPVTEVNPCPTSL